MQDTKTKSIQDKDFFFDITNRSKMPIQVYIGGRGIGKTYSALRFLSELPADEKWIYMRRTGKEIEACGTDFGNPFKTINRDFGRSILPESGGGGACQFFYNENDPDNPYIVGYGVALSTFAGLRSMDLSDVTYVVFDEFIPERQVKRIKGEGDALLNFYETVNRNRELQGRPPLVLILLSNAINLANPILEALGLIGELENMIEHHEHRRTIPARSLYIERVGRVGVSDAKRDTVLYRLANSDFTEDALSAQFLSADLSTIDKAPNLREFTPYFRFGKWVVFRKDRAFHITESTVTCAKVFPESAGTRVRAFFAPMYRNARAYGDVTFDKYVTQVFFDNVTGYEEITEKI